MNKVIEELLKALDKNCMKGIYANTKEDAIKIVKDMLFQVVVVLFVAPHLKHIMV